MARFRYESSSVGTAPDGQDAQLLQRTISFANRDPAGLVELSHRAFGRELLAWAQLSFRYLALDALGDVL
jgi:hypothetical protein